MWNSVVSSDRTQDGWREDYLTLTVPSLVNPTELLHIYMPMVMKGLKEEKIGDGILHTVLSVFVCVCVCVYL